MPKPPELARKHGGEVERVVERALQTRPNRSASR